MARQRDFKRFPMLAGWLASEDKRKKFVKWVDEALGIDGNWLKDTQLGLELRLELYIDFLINERGWDVKKASQEHKRLLDYIEQFGDVEEE